jgi:hypothetical protein
METDERPSKMRKLGHEGEGDMIVDEEIMTTSTVATDGPLPVTTKVSEAGTVAEEILENENEEPKLSKNQLKKKRRLDEWEAGREDRKVKRKEKAKERKAQAGRLEGAEYRREWQCAKNASSTIAEKLRRQRNPSSHHSDFRL